MKMIKVLALGLLPLSVYADAPVSSDYGSLLFNGVPVNIPLTGDSTYTDDATRTLISSRNDEYNGGNIFGDGGGFVRRLFGRPPRRYVEEFSISQDNISRRGDIRNFFGVFGGLQEFKVKVYRTRRPEQRLERMSYLSYTRDGGGPTQQHANTTRVDADGKVVSHTYCQQGFGRQIAFVRPGATRQFCTTVNREVCDYVKNPSNAIDAALVGKLEECKNLTESLRNHQNALAALANANNEHSQNMTALRDLDARIGGDNFFEFQASTMSDLVGLHLGYQNAISKCAELESHFPAAEADGDAAGDEAGGDAAGAGAGGDAAGAGAGGDAAGAEAGARPQ